MCSSVLIVRKECQKIKINIVIAHLLTAASYGVRREVMIDEYTTRDARHKSWAYEELITMEQPPLSRTKQGSARLYLVSRNSW